MLKTVGIAMVTTGLCAAGFLYASYAKKRLKALEDALAAVELLKGQVIYLLAPLPIAIEHLSGQNALLKRLADARCFTGGEEMAQILAHMGMNRPEMDCFQGLMQAVPLLGAGQSGPFETAAEQLTALIAQQKKIVQRDGVLYPKLGLLAGFTAFLLLI